jgi:hypothetical protein
MRALILLALLALSGCNQVTLGSAYAVKNVLSLPISGLRSLTNSITGNNHSSMRELTLRAGVTEPRMLQCSDDSPVASEITDLEEVLTDMRGQLCSCQAWGTCSAPLCPCETLCPAHYGIFNRAESKPTGFPEHSNSFPFLNEPRAFESSRYPLTAGYCWGMTVFHQQMYRLGFFDSTKPAPHQEGTRQWLSYYRSILRDLNSNRAREIPGFASIREFTSHPAIQEIMTNDIIPQTWANRAMSSNGLSAYMTSSKSIPKSASASFVGEVRERLDQFHVNPTVLFRSKNNSSGVHIVAVHEVKKEGEDTILCLTDSNYQAHRNSSCQTTMTISASGVVTYSGWPGDEVVSMSIPKSDEADMVAQARALTRHCQSQRENCPAR